MKLAKVTQPVISSAGATYTLTERDSGSLVLFNRAAGITYTLPRPRVGLTFDFQATVTGTGSYKVITSAGTEFISGVINLGIDDDAGDKAFFGNGTTHIAVLASSAETGWLNGGAFSITCTSSTLWVVKGTLASSGTITTPFSTS